MTDAFSGIIGHERAVARLRKMLANGAFPHALVFHGPRRLGKQTLAMAAAASLLGTGTPARHPDFRLIARPRDEKTDKLKKLIPIDAIRELQEHLRMSAFLGGAKAAVIDEADALSEEAANAFLKTLEEPAPKTTIILCVESLDRLPKTVLSRSALIGLRRVSETALAAALEARGLAPKAAARAAARSDGRPGLALGFLEGGGMVDWYETEERRWRSLRGAPAYRRFAALSDLTPPRADREETVLRLRGVIDLWRSLLRKELLAGEPSAPSNLRRLQLLHQSLDANVQPRALLERFAITLDR